MTTTSELWRITKRSLEHGDFTLLEEKLESAGLSLLEIIDANDPTPKDLSEALTWACFVGQTDVVAELIDRGVDPAAGTATGMAALHWAANRGKQ